ncbi:MAG: hypothetical protein Q9206_004885, partial [Seirophora lacunosa]
MTRLPLGAPDFESLKSIGDVHEVVIAIEEDHIAAFQHIPQPSKAFTAPSRNLAAPSFRLQAPTPPLADRPTSPISLTVSCPSPSSPSHSRSVSPISVESSARSHTSSPTLVRKASITSPGTYSPVMRSMFPHYDPTISLGQQRYFPQIAVSPPAAIYSTRTDDVGSYTPSLYTQQEPSFDGEAVGWSNGLGLHSEGEFLDGPSESPQFSTPDELLSWWALANGQTTAEDAKDYKLELSCDNLEAGKEIICFDSSTSQSLYSLTATNDHLSISRSHPLNDTTTIQISALTLQTPSSSSSLIATISPKLAELAAIDKSSSAAVEHRLDRKASTALQTEAVERACRQEASSLLWDGESRKYYLIHPTLLEDNSPAAFPIEVTSHEGTPRAIKILAPGDFPNLPVLELSFETLCLDIHVEVITAYSSRYLLDTLLSTTL